MASDAAGDNAELRQFMEITGTDIDQARTYLEIGNGSCEAALGFFFGGGGAAPAAPSSSNPHSAAALPDWFQLVWGSDSSVVVPEAWLNQPLEFATAASGDEAATAPQPYRQMGLVQRKNGPCGLLAALNAVMIAQLRARDRKYKLECQQSADAGSAPPPGPPPVGPTLVATDLDLACAIARLLSSPAIGSTDATPPTAVTAATWAPDVNFAEPQSGRAVDHIGNIEFQEVCLCVRVCVRACVCVTVVCFGLGSRQISANWYRIDTSMVMLPVVWGVCGAHFPCLVIGWRYRPTTFCCSQVGLDMLRDFVLAHLAHYKAPGGLLLIMYAALFLCMCTTACWANSNKQNTSNIRQCGPTYP